jgi:hypothetical protein
MAKYSAIKQQSVEIKHEGAIKICIFADDGVVTPMYIGAEERILSSLLFVVIAKPNMQKRL